MDRRSDEDPPPEPLPTHPATSKKPAGPPTWVAMSGIGFEFVAAVLLPGAVGWWLDRKAGTLPWLMLAGGLIGFVVGLRLLMNAGRRAK